MKGFWVLPKNLRRSWRPWLTLQVGVGHVYHPKAQKNIIHLELNNVSVLHVGKELYDRGFQAGDKVNILITKEKEK